MDRAALLAELADCGLLTASAVQDHLRAPGNRRLDAKELARILVQHQAITPFQANQLLARRGRELRLGSYLLQERIGQGGMGSVYKAIQQNFNRVVALKVLNPQAHENERTALRFQREIELTAKLKHPNIVEAIDAQVVHGQKFLVMEYVAGFDLNKLVKKIGPLPLDMACHCMYEAALGLQYAHERSLIHRDLKPSNLLLETSWAHSDAEGSKRRLVYGKVKLVDLGLAKVLDDTWALAAGKQLTVLHQIVGTPDYMAPEQAQNNQDASPLSDIYSLGATFYYCLTGQTPFTGDTPLEKIMAHATEEARPVESLRKEVPPRLGQLIRQMMAKDPAERPQSSREVAEALTRWQDPPTVLVATASGPALPAQALEATPVDDETPASTLQFLPADGRLTDSQLIRRRNDGPLWTLVIVGGIGALLALLLLLRILGAR